MARQRAGRGAAAWLIREPKGQLALAVALYLGYAIFVTWPLVTELGSSVYLSPARPHGDYTGIIAHSRELVEGLHNPFVAGRIEDFNAPRGIPVLWSTNIATFPSTIAVYVLMLVFGATAAMSLFVLAGFVATGAAMFLLVRHLTGNPWVALVAGLAYAFIPYAVANGEHPHHIHNWPLVLVAWRMIELWRSPTRRNGVWAGLAVVLGLAWTPYFLLMGAVTYGTLVAVALVDGLLRRRLREQLIPQVVCLLIVVAFVGSIRLISRAAPDVSAIPPTPTLVDLTAQSARPLNYILPSGRNLLFGDLTRETLQVRGWYDNAEKSLYVGWTLILLAGFAGIAALRRRPTPELARVTLAFAAVVVVALAFSAPPQVLVGDTLIDFPGYYVNQLGTPWRIISRFVVVVALGLTVMASIGIVQLLRGRSPRTAALVLAIIGVAIPLDLWSRHDPRTGDLTPPSIYSTLRDQPPGIVAEYPLQFSNATQGYEDLYFQDAHDKPIFNGYPARTEDEARATTLTRLDRRTAERLRAEGVRYVLLRHGPHPAALPDPGIPGRGYEKIAEDDYAALYRITAPPRP